MWVQLVPSRKAFFEALGQPGEQMMQDIRGLFNAFQPVLQDIQKFLAENNLDFPTKV